MDIADFVKRIEKAEEEERKKLINELASMMSSATENVRTEVTEKFSDALSAMQDSKEMHENESIKADVVGFIQNLMDEDSISENEKRDAIEFIEFIFQNRLAEINKKQKEMKDTISKIRKRLYGESRELMRRLGKPLIDYNRIDPYSSLNLRKLFPKTHEHTPIINIPHNVYSIQQLSSEIQILMKAQHEESQKNEEKRFNELKLLMKRDQWLNWISVAIGVAILSIAIFSYMSQKSNEIVQNPSSNIKPLDANEPSHTTIDEKTLCHSQLPCNSLMW